MSRSKVALAFQMTLATLFSSLLLACVTSAPGSAVKQNSTQQEVTVGSRIARSTCKPAAVQTTEPSQAAVTPAQAQ